MKVRFLKDLAVVYYFNREDEMGDKSFRRWDVVDGDVDRAGEYVDIRFPNGDIAFDIPIRSVDLLDK